MYFRLAPIITNILYYISGFSVLVPLGIGIAGFKRLDPNSRIVMIVLTFSTIAQLLSLYPNLSFVDALFNSYCVSDALVWGYLFYRNSRNKWIRNSIIVLISLQVLATLYMFVKYGINARFYSEFVCLSSLLQVLWVLAYFYERYKREEIQALEREPMFWFCLGILIYAPATYFRFAFFDSIGKTDYAVKIIHHILNTCMYLIFSIGILLNIFKPSKLRNVFIHRP
jgi:hypothetical protein